MSLFPRDILSIPAETKRVAEAAFPKGNTYMTMRDQLALWYKDSDYAYLFRSHQGQPALSPGRLKLVILMQYAEGVSDRQTVEAVGSRIDWKYALGLALTAPSFHASVLSDYRQRLLDHGAEGQLFEQMLSQFQGQGLLTSRGQQRTDSTHVLAAIRSLNRLECIGETLRQALNRLATVTPDWVRAQVSPDWFERYGPRFEQYRLPKSKAERQALAEQIGRDGQALLDALYAASDQPWLAKMPAVDLVRQVWLQQFMVEADQLRLRASGNLPPVALMIQCPYDAEARYSWKRQTHWTGYKVHLTETCEAETPHLITNVETTPAPPDDQLTETNHAHLAEQERLPAQHLVDTGYTTAAQLVRSHSQYQMELVGPVQRDSSWQARAQAGFALADFEIDWPNQQAICPQGQRSVLWSAHDNDRGHPVIEVRFAKTACTPCPSRSQCTQAQKNPRSLKLRQQSHHQALQAARLYQTTPEFKERYKKRAGVEGTISQATRGFELRRARYIGLAKTRLQHLLIAAALNLTRAVAWLQDQPVAQTRPSAFAALAPVTSPH